MFQHKVLALLGLAIATNLDNLGVAVGYSLARRHISVNANLIITLTTVILTYAAMLAGKLLTSFLPSETINHLGAWIIFAVGVQMLWEQNANSKTASEDVLIPKRLTFTQTVVLGGSLSLNAMAGGLGAALSGQSLNQIALTIGIASFATIALGQTIGKRLNARTVGISGTAAGLILIGIGVYELFY